MIDLSKRNVKNTTGLDLSKVPDEDHHAGTYQIEEKQVYTIEKCKQMVVHNRLNNYGRLIIRGQLILV